MPARSKPLVSAAPALTVIGVLALTVAVATCGSFQSMKKIEPFRIRSPSSQVVLAPISKLSTVSGMYSRSLMTAMSPGFGPNCWPGATA